MDYRLDKVIKYFREDPERTDEYKAMQAALYPRGSTLDAKQRGDNATAHRVGGWKNPKDRGKKKKVMGEEGMVVGADGATAAADDAGPLAGFDPKMKGKMLRRKVIGRWSRSLRKKKEIKESYNSSDWRDGYRPTEFESVDVIKPEPLQPTKSILNIEVPQTQTDFNMGLMFRDELEENSGMLFAFQEEGQKYFHMKDTTIPLDIAFINKEGIIESIKELIPLSTVPVSSDSTVLYALEVNRGWFEKNGVGVGDKVLDNG